MGKCKKFSFFNQLLILLSPGFHLSLPADELQDFGQSIDVFNGANQVHVFQQCSWVPPSLAKYPEYYSSSSLTQTATNLARSSFERTVESVHRIVTRFHVVRRSNGSGGVDENLLSAMMLDLNYGYRDTPFVFVRDPELIYVDNDVFFAAIAEGWDAEKNEMDWGKWAQVAFGRMHPLRELEQEPNMPASHIAREFGIRGPVYNCLTACAASTQAIGEANTAIERGDADVMISGGAHTMIHVLGVTGFNRLTALSTFDGDPTLAAR